MNATFSQVTQLIIGTVIGAGVCVTMERNGVSIFRRDSRIQGLCIIVTFCSIWLIGMTLLTVTFGQ